MNLTPLSIQNQHIHTNIQLHTFAFRVGGPIGFKPILDFAWDPSNIPYNPILRAIQRVNKTRVSRFPYKESCCYNPIKC